MPLPKIISVPLKLIMLFAIYYGIESLKVSEVVDFISALFNLLLSVFELVVISDDIPFKKNCIYLNFVCLSVHVFETATVSDSKPIIRVDRTRKKIVKLLPLFSIIPVLDLVLK